MSVTKEQRAEWDRMLGLLRPVELPDACSPVVPGASGNAPVVTKPKARGARSEVVVLLELGEIVESTSPEDDTRAIARMTARFPGTGDGS